MPEAILNPVIGNEGYCLELLQAAYDFAEAWEKSRYIYTSGEREDVQNECRRKLTIAASRYFASTPQARAASVMYAMLGKALELGSATSSHNDAIDDLTDHAIQLYRELHPPQPVPGLTPAQVRVALESSDDDLEPESPDDDDQDGPEARAEATQNLGDRISTLARQQLTLEQDWRRVDVDLSGTTMTGTWRPVGSQSVRYTVNFSEPGLQIRQVENEAGNAGGGVPSSTPSSGPLSTTTPVEAQPQAPSLHESASSGNPQEL